MLGAIFKFLKKIGPISLGIVLFSLIALQVNDAHQYLARVFQWQFIVLGVLGVVVANILAPLRWHYVTNIFAGKETFVISRFILVGVLTRVFGFIVPKDISDIGGRIIWLNKKAEIPLGQSTAIVLFDKVLDLILIVILGLASLPFWFGLFDGKTTILLMAIIWFLALTVSVYSSDAIWKLASQILLSVSRLAKFKGQHLFQVDRDTLSISTNYAHLKIPFYLTLAKYIIISFRPVWISLAFGLNIPLIVLLIAMPLGQILFLLSFTPGAIGILELGWIGILLLAGIDTGEATVFAISQRLIIFAGVAVSYVGALLFHRRHAKENCLNS